MKLKDKIKLYLVCFADWCRWIPFIRKDLIEKFKCYIEGHKYRIVQVFREQNSKRIKCTRCKGDWVMNDNLQAILPWSKEFEEMYRMIGNNIIEPVYSDGKAINNTLNTR